MFSPRPRLARSVASLAVVAIALAACSGDGATPPPATPGTAASPRAVPIIAKDFSYLPPVVEVFPGETVLLQVVNGGLALHEVVIGDAAVQAAWEEAEAATADAPPGPTPFVDVAPDLRGIRVVVASGERRDVLWTVPSSPAAVGALVVGCHIPGHWAKGMQVPVAVRG